MHHDSLEYTTEDAKYSHYQGPDSVNQETKVHVGLNYNSDFSREVELYSYYEDAFGNAVRLGHIWIPGWMILEFAGRFMQREVIESVEQQTGLQTLTSLPLYRWKLIGKEC